MAANARIRRILAIRNDRFGEFLLTIPAFNALKKNYPGSCLAVAVDPYVQELAERIASVDEVLVLENKKYGFAEIIKLSRQLKQQKFDICVIFNPSKYFNMAVFLAGIPVRIGYDHKAAFLLTHRIKDVKYAGHKHEIDYNLELVAFTQQLYDRSLALSLEDDAIAALCQEHGLSDKKQIVAIHPWTSDSVKQWPLENFKALARKIALELDTKVVVVGGSREAPLGQDYFNAAGKNIVNLTGKTTLVQLGALLKKCTLLVSGDSGPVHLAACVDTPVIALFRNDLPGKGAVRWGPRSHASVVIERNSLFGISVEEVFAQVKGKLGI